MTYGVRVAGIFLFGNMLYLFIQSFFQSFFLMRERTVVMILYGLAYLVVAPALIFLGVGYASPLMAFSLATYTSFLLGFVLAWRRKIRLLPTTSREDLHVMDQLRFATPTYATMLMAAIFAQAGIVLMKIANLEVIQIGYFRAVYNIVAVGSFIAVTLNVVILPYVSELESKKDSATLSYFCSLIIKFLIIFGIPSSIGIYLIAEPSLSIMLPQYLDAAGLMKILSLMLLFFPIFTVSHTMLIGAGRPMLILRANVVSVASIFLLGGFLSQNMGAEGIAYAYVLAISLATVYSLVMMARALGFHLEPAFIVKVAISTTVMGITAYLIIQWMSTSMMKIALGVPTGIVTYLALTILLKTMSSEDYRVIRRTLGIARSKAPSKALRN